MVGTARTLNPNIEVVVRTRLGGRRSQSWRGATPFTAARLAEMLGRRGEKHEIPFACRHRTNAYCLAAHERINRHNPF